jgi:hypothetical protein
MFQREINSAEAASKRIHSILPEIKSGTLRFWGHWFGRPADNVHRIVGCAAEGEILRVFFHQAETLTVWSPRRMSISGTRFKIGKADKVRWEWFYYGRPRMQANLYYLEFERSPDRIVANSNVDWYKPSFETDAVRPAVEIV